VPGLVAASSSDGFSLPALLAASGVAIAWLLTLAALWFAHRPPGIDGDPPTIDLGAEPPAIAALLCDDYEVRTETPPATLLDLAARGVISLEEVRPGETICVVRSSEAGSAPLAPFERHVLAALQSKAIDGVIPAAALTTGTELASSRWHRDLAKLVVADAQQRGLTIDRWAPAVVRLVSAGVVVVVGLLILAGVIGGDADAAPVLTGVAVATAIGGAFLLGATAGRMRRSLAQLPTREGANAEARWLGVRAHLAQNEQLERLPPAAVKIYGRHFAYAAGFGLADHAVAALPFGEEDDHLAWSAHGGRWRRVRIRYPQVRPPGWGLHPALATLVGLASLAVFAYLAVALVRIDDNAAVVAATVFAIPLAWSLWVLSAAVPDLFTTRTVTGTVLRCRTRTRWVASNDPPRYWYYVAIDDGTRDRIAAFRVREDTYSRVHQGQAVVAEVAPRLGYVRSLR
jgi:Predicted membrane protein (DUF2207) C-terminal domain